MKKQPAYTQAQPPTQKGDILTPSDGYRRLALDILFPPIHKLNCGEDIETHLAFILSRRARVCFQLLDKDPDVMIEAILKRNGLEIVKR